MNEGGRDLDGRVALVTGASRGIGKAIAMELGRGGARTGVHCRARREEADAVARGIEDFGTGDASPHPRAAVLCADLAIPEAAVRLAGDCLAALGPVDTLVLNAGVWNGMPADAVDRTVLEDLFAINLESLFHLTGAIVPGMKKRGFGRIVGISSTASLLGEPGHAHYAASKGAMDAFIRSLAVEFGPFGITANSVAPGWTMTEMTRETLNPEREREIAGEIPTGRIAAPEDVAHVVRFLASRGARHVNGVTIPVDGGYRIRR